MLTELRMAPTSVGAAPVPTPNSAWAKLAEKYGPEKTALSSRITSNLTSVIKDGMELANMAATNSGASSLAEAASRNLVRGGATRLGLTEEQQRQATVILEPVIGKRVQAVTDLMQTMGSEPEPVMELMLAGDALARNQITQAEYDRVTASTRAMLQQVGDFVTGRAGGAGGSQVLLDPEVTAQLSAILTPEQQAKLVDMVAATAEKAQTRMARPGTITGNSFQPGQLPVMELDRLDQTVSSFRQMTEAGRMMLEAMKGLREANAKAQQ